MLSGGPGVLLEYRQALGKSGLAPGGSVRVDRTLGRYLIEGLIDPLQLLPGRFQLPLLHQQPELLDLRPQSANAGTVPHPPLFVLPDPLLGRQ